MKTRYWIPALLVVLLALNGGSAFGQTDWTKHVANPVVGAPGPWYQGALTPNVLYNPDSSRFEMWFCGSAYAAGQRPWRIGHAVSNDGVSWTVRATPVLVPDAGQWDSYTTEAPYVIRQNGQYKMWYTGTTDFVTFATGYATSGDGVQWTKYAGNPVFTAGRQTWELAGPGYGCVLPSGGGYKMWYASTHRNGSNEYIGYAVSADGIHWQRDTVNNPVLSPGPSGQWDDFMTTLPRVMQSGNLYYLWYLGGRQQYSLLRGGVATSSNGITSWVRDPNNPVLRPSPSGWDRSDVEIGSVVVVGDSLYLYYDGFSTGTRWQIGLAKGGRWPVEVAERRDGTPVSFVLGQNYPNPYNPSTTIRYALPERSTVTLTVYNTLGQEVATLVRGEKEAGYQEAVLDASGLSSGVYFYRLVAGTFTETKRMLLLR